jgi:transcriptional regulator with XRE-family HTH domain
VETFGQRLKRLRDEKGLTADQLSASAGCTSGTIYLIESGRTKFPSFVIGLRLADALGVDPYWFALGDHATLTERMDIFDRRLARLERRIEESEKA